MTPETPHILVVDDEHFILGALQLYFESNGFVVSTASGMDDALQIFDNWQHPVDAVILDLVMPGVCGLDILKLFKQKNSSVQIIIATGCGSMDTAIEALRLGAFDFITKPILDFDKDLMKSVRNALEVRRKLAQANTAGTPGNGNEVLPVSCGPDWLGVYEDLNQFAATYAGKPPLPQVLGAVWKLLANGFGADAAAVAVQNPDDSWSSVHSWGFATAPDISHLHDQLSAGKSGVTTEFLRETELTESAADHLTEVARATVLQLPLASSNGRRTLLLYCRVRDGIDPGTGPLALLNTVISPILTQEAPQPENNKAVEEPHDTALESS